MKSLHTIRLGALAAALALAMPVAHAADTTNGAPAPQISKVNLTTMQPGESYDRFIVTYRQGSSERANHAVALQNVSAAVARAGFTGGTARLGQSAAAPLTVSYKRKLGVGADLVKISRKLNPNEASELMHQIAADPAVEHVEADVMLHLVRDTGASAKLSVAMSDASTPNDPYFAEYQWHLKPGDGDTSAVGSDAIGYANYGGADTSPVWNLTDGAGVTVAVLDTGLTHHPDLDTSLGDSGYDFITDAFTSGRSVDGRVPGGWDTGDWTNQDPWMSACTSPNRPPQPSSWHGTHVSGTIAELTGNGVGMAGSAGAAKVLPVRVLGHCGGATSDIADAIEWASGGHVDGVPDNQNPAQVISLSLGGGGTCSASDVTGKAIADAISRGATVVVAAGNSGADTTNFTPANCPGALTVASVGITGKRAYYSNFGSAVALAAPGGGIYANDASSGSQAYAGFVWSTLNASSNSPDESASGYVYGGMAGTSQATPHVSGAIALVIAARREAGLSPLSPTDIKALLTSSARSFPVTPDHPIGAGILDAYAAVNKALGRQAPDPAPLPLVNGTLLGGQAGNGGQSIIYKIDVPAGASNLNIRSMGGTGDVAMYVKAGAVPVADGSDADFASNRPGTTELVSVPRPAATTYYVRVVGVMKFSGLSMLAVYTAPR
ncbi:protease [Rhodanobacter sp. PCA2]|nr:protease [Rhodanobacter sp. PCA2]